MEIITLPHYEELDLPAFQSPEAAGVDLRAAIPETLYLKPGESAVIPSGLKVDIGSWLKKHNLPWGLNIYGCVLPRSGLGFKHFVRLANTAGVIDSDYLGEIMIKVRNEGYDLLEIERGTRICQMVFHVCLAPFDFEPVDEFTRTTQRGEGGIGSSGVK